MLPKAQATLIVTLDSANTSNVTPARQPERQRNRNKDGLVDCGLDSRSREAL